LCHHITMKTSRDVQIVKVSEMKRLVRVRKRSKQKDKKRNLTVANWVFAQTTHMVASKSNSVREVAFGRGWIDLRFEFP